MEQKENVMTLELLAEFTKKFEKLADRVGELCEEIQRLIDSSSSSSSSKKCSDKVEKDC